MLSWNGASWVASFISEGKPLRAVWTDGPNFSVAVGDAGVALISAGGEWTSLPPATNRDLSAAWGRGPDDVWVGGKAGTLLHWDGETWTDHSSLMSGVDIEAIDGDVDPAGEILAVGPYSLRIGPFMPFPTVTVPATNGVLANFLAWQLPEAPLPDYSTATVTDFMGMPLWQMLTRGTEADITLPDLGAMGMNVLTPGPKRILFTHIKSHPDTVFDIDNYSNLHFTVFRRSTWAQRTVEIAD